MTMLLDRLYRVTLTIIATKQSTTELFAYHSGGYKRFEELRELHNLTEDMFRYDQDHDEEIFSDNNVVLTFDYIPDSLTIETSDICYSR